VEPGLLAQTLGHGEGEVDLLLEHRLVGRLDLQSHPELHAVSEVGQPRLTVFTRRHIGETKRAEGETGTFLERAFGDANLHLAVPTRDHTAARPDRGLPRLGVHELTPLEGGDRAVWGRDGDQEAVVDGPANLGGEASVVTDREAADVSVRGIDDEDLGSGRKERRVVGRNGN
jgi:hypothetical protein